MNLLAVDTSGPVCGVAVLADGALRCEHTVVNKRTHSVNLMPMIDGALQAAGLTLAAVVLMVRLSTAGGAPAGGYGPNSVRV